MSASDFNALRLAVSTAAAELERVRARVAELLAGQQPGEELFAQAGRLASEDCSPTADQRGPVDYKRHLAGELTTRVLRRAAARAAVAHRQPHAPARQAANLDADPPLVGELDRIVHQVEQHLAQAGHVAPHPAGQLIP